MRKLLVALCVFICTSTYAQQVAKSLTAANGVNIGFLEYKPTDYNPNIKYPLIIFLHGIGERGNGTTDLQNVANTGLPGNIKNGSTMRFTWNGKTETFLVLSPQLSTNYGDWQDFYVDEMLNYAQKNLSYDPNRVYLTGLSLGGGGTWHYAGNTLANAKKFAAVGVSCGTCQGINWCNYASANLPVWAFHAQDDHTVGVGCTTSAISNINNCKPAVKPYMTIWPDGDHYIWGRVYDETYNWQNPNLYEWFLGQNKSLPVNTRPVAKAENPLPVTTVLGIATLDASGSYDPDGKIVRYVWRKISGPAYGAISASVSLNGITAVTGLTTAGTYQYEVKVIDDRADWSFDTVTVTVGTGTRPPGNQPPVANAGNSSTINLPTNSATLDGSSSLDPDGSIASYAWTWVSGPTQYNIANAGAASTLVSNLVQGTYTFSLKVTDNSGATSTATVQLIVNAASGGNNGGGTAPVIFLSAGPDIILTLPSNSTTLNGSGSDSRGPVSSYKWTKFSGPGQYNITSPSSAVTTITNLVEGTYGFRLDMWDNAWVPRGDTVMVIVRQSDITSPPPANTTVTVNAGPDATITLPTNSLTLNGTASDTRGPVKSIKWEKISGPAQYTITSPDALATSVTNLAEGVYSFRLNIWDNAWTPKGDTVVVTVKAGTGTGNGGNDNNGGGITAPGISINAGPDVTLTLPTNSVTLNGTASDARGPVKAYKWVKIGGPAQYNISSPDAASTNITNLVAGTYIFRFDVWDNAWLPRGDSIIISVLNSNASATVTNSASATAIGAEDKTEKISLYPNPVDDIFNLQYSSSLIGKAVINIYDIHGKLMRRVAVEKTSILYRQPINVAGFTPGIYYVEMIVENQKRVTAKFIKH